MSIIRSGGFASNSSANLMANVQASLLWPWACKPSALANSTSQGSSVLRKLANTLLFSVSSDICGEKYYQCCELLLHMYVCIRARLMIC